ncbi:hypothetical protein N5D77_08265 [Comamonas thiooxydans]|uniref:Uncharacterized protein n=1 Tax=Comamonas thiooxydans TaxID=363952 RepID=A0AA42Q1S2_9BURK|nr:hypothetical protein [Comamonas thiooxydans]MDH1334221.1 hypothetical protein [Comamonas thiooxydans]MDH1740182.1 hypothetical protein [Comamonas thiooxydans]MDH1786563.1 hypothetical protein [Comamonas thiooxydans]
MKTQAACKQGKALHLLHPEKYLQNSLKFLWDGSDNSFNRETKPCHQRATAAKHKELQAGVLDWAAAAAHPEKVQVTVAATF